MTANPENLGHFIFNSDYPTDKIIWLYEGQFTTTSSTSTFYINLPDNMGAGAPIFCKGAVTLDNWASSIMVGTGYSQAGKNASMYIVFYTYNGVSRLQVDVDFRSFPNKTAKYRLWGVQREDISNSTDYPKNTAFMKNKLILDSDRNYPRLCLEGVAISGETVKHNLGKIPYIDYWYQIQRTISPYTKENAFLSSWRYNPKGALNASIGNYPTITATDKEVTFSKMLVNGNEQTDVLYYYRLYA